MTNAKVYQGFHDDKKVEEHWFTWCWTAYLGMILDVIVHMLKIW